MLTWLFRPEGGRIVDYYEGRADGNDLSVLASQVLHASHHGSRTFVKDDKDAEPWLRALDAISPEDVVIFGRRLRRARLLGPGESIETPMGSSRRPPTNSPQGLWQLVQVASARRKHRQAERRHPRLNLRGLISSNNEVTPLLAKELTPIRPVTLALPIHQTAAHFLRQIDFPFPIICPLALNLPDFDDLCLRYDRDESGSIGLTNVDWHMLGLPT